MAVEKRPVPLAELSSFEEAAGCGTAVVITPLSRIDVKPVLEESFVDKSFRFFLDGAVGPVSRKLYGMITSIQNGEAEDTHGWCHVI